MNLSKCELLIFVALLPGFTYGSEAYFDYYSTDYGTGQWSELFPTCGGSEQSPIDLDQSACKENQTLGLFTHAMFENKFDGITLKNDGHELIAAITSGAYTIDNPYLLQGAHTLEQFHFHWGDSPTHCGSEHKLSGEQFYGEMHLVHYNAKYVDYATAKTKRDGLAVLAFFIEASYQQDNMEFQRLLNPIIDGLLTHQNSQYDLPEDDLFAMEVLLPHDLSMYYKYHGSLTTPTCDEVVTWIVFKDPIYISPAQANILSTSLYATDENGAEYILQNNYRPIQETNDREITRPVPLSQCNASHTNKGILFAVTTTTLVVANLCNL